MSRHFPISSRLMILVAISPKGKKRSGRERQGVQETGAVVMNLLILPTSPCPSGLLLTEKCRAGTLLPCRLPLGHYLYFHSLCGSNPSPQLYLINTMSTDSLAPVEILYLPMKSRSLLISALHHCLPALFFCFL